MPPRKGPAGRVRSKGRARSRDIEVGDFCGLLEDALTGDVRGRILDTALASRTFPAALQWLREGMRSHFFRVPPDPPALALAVQDLDRRTRDEGFHVLQAWDHVAQRFTPDDLPVLLLDYYDYLRGPGEQGRPSLAILLDFYFLHLVALVVMRAWDHDDPDGMFDRVDGLLAALQGPGGSGHHFVERAGGLLILAVSHFHPLDAAYEDLIERMRGLEERHRLPFARASAGVLGSHLRWGLSQMYQGDVERMREDNKGDYPWLLFTVDTLLDVYARMEADGDPEAEAVGADLLNALTADPDAFAQAPPPALETYQDVYGRVRARLEEVRGPLGARVRGWSPETRSYSPLSFHFNFPHNTVVASTTLALLAGRGEAMSLEALILHRTGDGPDGDAGEGGGPDPRRSRAKALMHYAGARPERLEARGARLILYDAHTGRRRWEDTVAALFPEPPDTSTTP